VTELWRISQVAAHLKVTESRARAILASRKIKRVSGYPADQVRAISLRQGARTDLARPRDPDGDRVTAGEQPEKRGSRAGGLKGLKPGDPIVVSDQQKMTYRREVAHVGRVWLTDSHGDKFKIDNGQGEERSGLEAMTVEEHCGRDERPPETSGNDRTEPSAG
jgi:hypothetical protein